jgi:competence ComEA-like helix-hairpin-helix protein
MTETTEANRPVTLADIFIADDKGTPVADAVGQRVKEQNASPWKKFLWWTMKSTVRTEMELLMEGPISDELGGAFLSKVKSRIQREVDRLAGLPIDGAMGEFNRFLRTAQGNVEKYRKATPESPAEFQLKAFGLDPRQKITWKQSHTISLQGLVRNVRELEFDIDVVLAFSGASVGLATGYLHFVSLGDCDLRGSVLAWRLNGADMGTYQAKHSLTLPKIPFPRPIPLLPDELAGEPIPARLPVRAYPPGDRRTTTRRSAIRRVRVRRVSTVAVGVERRTADRREAERRAASGGERRTVTRRIGERRVSTDLRQGERHMVTRSPLATSPATVDVNRADVEVLQSLPGVGPTLAERIIAERQKRLFASQDELARVQGLGAAMVERLRPHITVGGGS